MHKPTQHSSDRQMTFLGHVPADAREFTRQPRRDRIVLFAVRGTEAIALGNIDDANLETVRRVAVDAVVNAIAVEANTPSTTNPRTCISKKHAGKLHATTDGTATLCCLKVRRLIEGRPQLYIGESQFCRNCADLWRRGVRIEPLRAESVA